MLLLPPARHGTTSKKNLIYFPLAHTMETADNVTGKYEDCWDGTKEHTIYVWNINKMFCAI